MQKYLAVALIMNANKAKYESLWNKLENDLLVGQDSYPTSIGGATHLLTNWKVNNTPNRQQPPSNNRDNRTGGGRNVTFVQVPLPANDDFSALPGYDPDRPTCAPSRKHPHNITAHITCVHCNKLGHYATACPFIIAGRPQFFQHLSSFQVALSSIPDPLSIVSASVTSFLTYKHATHLKHIPIEEG
jgi:hypothetical protein